MSTHNIHYFIEDKKDILKLSSFDSRSGTQWPELSVSRTNFCSPKAV